MSKEGFEPPTLWFVATCSSPLSYMPFRNKIFKEKNSFWKKEFLFWFICWLLYLEIQRKASFLLNFNKTIEKNV